MSERVNALMDYLDRLTKLNEGGYNCNKEIAECVLHIRSDLDMFKVEPMVVGVDKASGKDWSNDGDKKNFHDVIDKATQMFKDLEKMKGNK